MKFGMTDKNQDTDMLRAKAAVLFDHARSQSAAIQRAMASVQHDPALHARLAAAAAQMAGVAETLSHALGASSFALHAVDLAALEGAVQSGETGTLVTEATASQAAAAAATLKAQVMAASAGTRQEVQTLSHDLFERRVFDPYLHFSSSEDEAGFRQREADARSYIHDQLALGTPEGNLNAAGGAQGYLLDAHVHGAGDSPDFLPKWNALAETTQRQHAAMRAAGQSTAKYDRRMAAAARQLLRREKHLSDAEIDRILAGHADPLEAVKEVLEKSGRDHNSAVGTDRPREPVAHHAPDVLPEVVASPGTAIPTSAAPLPLDAMTAKLKAAGVRLTDTGDAAPAHGIAAPKPITKPGLAAGG